MASTFARSSALNLAAGVSTTFGGFVSTVLVARLLGVEGTGVVAYAVWLVTVAVVVADLGIPGALARYLPELASKSDTAGRDGLTRFLLVRFGAALAFGSLCFAGYASVTAWNHPSPAGVGAMSYRDDWLFWVIVGSAFGMQGLAAFTNGYLRGEEAFRDLALMAIVGAAVQVGTTLAGAWWFGIAGAMCGAVSGFVVPAAFALRIAWRSRGRVRADLKHRVVRFAFGTWGSYVVTAFAWSRMEIFFLERSWGSQEAGLFSVSVTMANLATQAPLLLTGALLPFLSRQTEADAVERLPQVYATGIRLMALVAFPSCFGLAAIAHSLLPALFGAGFLGAASTTTILLTAAAFSATASIATTYLFAIERTRVVFVTGALGAALAIGVGLVLVPTYGAMAAALGRASIQTLLIVVVLWFLDRQLRCPTPWGALLRLLVAALVCGAAALAATLFLPGPFGIPVAIAAGALTYGVALRLLRPLPATDLQHLSDAASILPGPFRRAVEAFVRALSPA